jgi:hypothetical protein
VKEPFVKLSKLVASFAVATAFVFAANASATAQTADKAPAIQVPPQSLAGDWKFNPAKSDDPAKKLVVNDDVSTGDTGTSIPVVGQMGGAPAGQNGTSTSMPPGAMGGMGAPGGMSGVGGGNQAPMPIPQMPATHRWETDKDRQKRLAEFLPADSLTVQQKDNEFDFIEADDRKLVFYTDGRKLKKSKDEKLQEFDARLDRGRLSYEEKRQPRGAVTRTFELSPDGHQMVETLEIDNGSITVPVVLKYVYDAVSRAAR